VRIPLSLLHRHAKEWRSTGVLTGPRGLFARLSGLLSGRFERRQGYAVSALEAIATLEAANPAAARLGTGSGAVKAGCGRFDWGIGKRPRALTMALAVPLVRAATRWRGSRRARWRG
jgi:hypothetical protein